MKGVEEIDLISSDKGKIVTVFGQATLSVSLDTTLCSKALDWRKKTCERLGFLYTSRDFRPPMTEFISSIKQES